jgi:undecaprenyl diphosphate synthase
MVKLDFIQNLIKDRFKHEEKNFPKHVVLDSYGSVKWAEKNNKSIKDAYRKKLENIKEIIKIQVEKEIPILTIDLLAKETKEDMSDIVSEFLESLAKEETIIKNKVRVTVLGKWYNLAKLVEPIKKITEDTKIYDSFFLNFCINYDGQEEIMDSLRVMAKKIEMEKLKSEDITKEEIKDNLYSSYFVPVDLIIQNRRDFRGVLLWDSVNAKIVFSNKLFPDFTGKDFLKALEEYQE